MIGKWGFSLLPFYLGIIPIFANNNYTLTFAGRTPDFGRPEPWIPAGAGLFFIHGNVRKLPPYPLGITTDFCYTLGVMPGSRAP